MDDKWFKQKQKQAGVTAEEIGAALGRDRSVVSRIYVGRQKMTLDQAHVFARILKVPLQDVLDRAGLLASEADAIASPGFSDSEVVPFKGQGAGKDQVDTIARHLGGGKPGIDIWRTVSTSLSFNGFLKGDYLLIDANQSELCKKGDIVVAQVYDWQTGTAETVLRRFEPPILLAIGGAPEDVKINVVDNQNVVIKGKVIASWRAA